MGMYRQNNNDDDNNSLWDEIGELEAEIDCLENDIKECSNEFEEDMAYSAVKSISEEVLNTKT